MIVFHGGFSYEQIKKIMNNKFILYQKSNYELFRIKQSNTFKYYNTNSKNKKAIINNIIEQNYINQWIHCYKYLSNSLYFCEEDYNYVVAFEIPDNILEKYIGVGNYKYEGYKVEYRIPREEISSDNVVDIFQLDYLSENSVKNLKEKYKEKYSSLNEHEEAKKILKKINQKCNYI